MSVVVSDSQKISALTEVTSLSSTDNLVVETSDGTKRVQYQNLYDVATESADGLLSSEDKTEIDAENRWTPRDIKSLVTSGAFKTAITTGSFLPLNIKEGDYFTGVSGYKYILAHYNYFYGGYSAYSIVNTKHYSLIVDTGVTHNWNSSNDTTGGYASSAIHAYLTDTVLTNVESDMTALGLTVLSHQKLCSTGINSTGYNRFGSNTGCSNSWAWSTSQKISLMTEMQLYGGTIWSSSGYDTGEAKEELKVFETYNPGEIMGNKWFWLRDVASASYACHCSGDGAASYYSASNAAYVVALISVY